MFLDFPLTPTARPSKGFKRPCRRCILTESEKVGNANHRDRERKRAKAAKTSRKRNRR